MVSTSIGAIESWEKTDTSVLCRCADFSVELSCISESTFRVRARLKGNTVKHHSYAVLPDTAVIPLRLEETDKALIISTAKASLHIGKDPFRITLKSPDGRILSQDDPAFGISHVGTEMASYRSLQPGERFVGLGEKVGPVDRRGHAYVNYNTDKFGYSVEEDPLYLSTPFFIGIHEQGQYGIFLDNTYRSRFNFGASTKRFSWFSVDDGEMDYYLFAGDTVQDIISSYADLTGHMPMPPKWSLGYQQCRYSYYPDHEVSTLAKTFRDKAIPADVLYLDIHYMQDYKAFTFDDERFPDPEGLHDELTEQGFRTVAIVDPGIKVEKGYGTYDRGIARDAFATLPDGTRYEGEVWPSWSHFPDFTNADARAWWADEIAYYPDKGVAGIWNDMNEPAAWGQCLPELVSFANEGRAASHKEVRNVFGMQMARSTREGLEKKRPDERPFVLTRAGFSGVQRYSAVWTGDNVSSEDHLMLSCRMMASMGLTAMPFTGNDIGGFAEEASPELFARWMSVAVFQPMCRAHTQVNTRDAEPWSFGEEVEQICRNYISLRYRLMPYVYTAFRRAHEQAEPVMRSMAIDHAGEELIYDSRYENQYYFGRDLLICPARSEQEFLEVYLPQGSWYDFYTDERYEGGHTHIVSCPLHKLPVFVRAGAVIPMTSQVQHTGESHDGKLYLHIYPGETREGGLYEDDGISHAHKDGERAWRTWTLNGSELQIEAQEGAFNSEFKTLSIHLHAPSSGIAVDTQALEAMEHKWQPMKPISGIDTFYADKGSDLHSQVQVAECDWTASPIKITW